MSAPIAVIRRTPEEMEARGYPNVAKAIAEEAYYLADAMMEERKRREK